MSLVQIVPELLQKYGRTAIAFGPEQCNHLPENSHAPLALSRALYNVPHQLCEAHRLWLSVKHKLRQSLCRVQQDILAARNGGDYIQPALAQPFFKSLPVRLRCHNDAGVASIEAGFNKAA